MIFALEGARIFDGYCFHENSVLVSESGKIQTIIPSSELDQSIPVTQLTGGTITPGLIDLQVNGGGGVLLNNSPTIETLNTMANAHAKFGVTQILPTVISDDSVVSLEVINAALACDRIHSGILGIHIEGPFFNPEKSGVHHLEKIRPLESDDWEWINLLAKLPSILTLAPETISPEDISKIAALGIKISAGHTNANYDEVAQAIENGLSGFTHLFNAMRQMHGRDPGVVGAAFDFDSTWAGIIADGIHVHPAAIKTAIKAKNYEKIYLVSDSMATIGSEIKHFDLYGEKIEEFGGRLVNSQGRLAGSAISLLDAVRYCIQKLEISVEQTLAMASRIPASYLGLEDQYGTFKPGLNSDICWLDDDWNVAGVWRAGIRL